LYAPLLSPICAICHAHLFRDTHYKDKFHVSWI
jgi:hypothetical protein